MFIRLTTLQAIDTAETVEEIVKLVFSKHNGQVELVDVSIYNVEITEVIQVKSEHTAQVNRMPEAKGSVNLEGLPHCNPIHRPSHQIFHFRDQAHYGLDIGSIEKIREISERLLETISGRIYITHPEKMTEYAVDLFSVGDEEWLKAYAIKKNVKIWIDEALNLRGS